MVYSKEKSLDITTKDTISGHAKITAYKKNIEDAEQPEEKVKTSVKNNQENCTYVIKVYDRAGSEGDTGSFTYTVNEFDYQKAGMLNQVPILRSQYTAGLYICIYLPKQ